MTDPRLPCRSLFAVWHWPRWTWAAIVILVLVAYVLSPPVVWFFCFHFGRWLNPYLPRGADHWIAAFFTPALYAQRWWIIDEIHKREFAFLTWFLIPHGD